jgi:mono/diheme cytochrome c family protein
MTRWILMLAVLLLLIFSFGCGQRPSHGFKLPPGDPAAGRQAFADLGCATCHTVQGTDLPAPHAVRPVALGGRRAEFPTIGTLTTDIIFPADRAEAPIGGKLPHPPMPDLADRITVRQLADLVTFLQAHYEYSPMPTAFK